MKPSFLLGQLLLAWEPVDDINLGAAGLFLAVVSPAALAIKSAVQAEDGLGAKYADRIRSMKSAIEAERTIPGLAALATDVHFHSGRSVRDSVNRLYESLVEPSPVETEDAQLDLQNLVADVLQNSVMRARLAQLKSFFFDSAYADALVQDAITLAHHKGVGTVVGLIGWVTLMIPAIVKPLEFPTVVLMLAAAAALCGATYAMASWLFESRSRQRLTQLLRKYG